MQALVTGGSGFIGSQLIRALNARGIRVRALLRKSSSKENLKGVDFETFYGDVTDFESLKRAVRGVDFVFHVAGVISARDREGFFLANAQGTGNLARACAEENPSLKRFVYVSSIAASGPTDSIEPKKESDAEQPVSAYGASKLAGEQELRRWLKTPFSIVRPPIVYGPRDKGIFELVKIVNRGIMPLARGRTESGEKFYSLVHVDDLVSGLLESGLHDGLGEEEIFFISGDGIHSWSKLMAEIAALLGKKPIRIPIPSIAWTGAAIVMSGISFLTGKLGPLTVDKLNDLRPDYWICSNERAKNRLGFQPRYTIEKGLTETVEWYKAAHWL